MRLNVIPSAAVSAAANTVGGVPVDREDDAATVDVVVCKLKQPLSPTEIDSNFILGISSIEFKCTCWRKISLGALNSYRVNAYK